MYLKKKKAKYSPLDLPLQSYVKLGAKGIAFDSPHSEKYC